MRNTTSLATLLAVLGLAACEARIETDQPEIRIRDEREPARVVVVDKDPDVVVVKERDEPDKVIVHEDEDDKLDVDVDVDVR